MAKVIGYRNSSFSGSDGSTVTGASIFLSYPLDNGVGEGCDRVFLTQARLNACGYSPKLGDEVRVEYNRYGKCSALYEV